MAGRGVEGGQLTLLITDLVRSTDLVQELGDLRSAEVFAQVEQLIRDRLAQTDGLEIDKTDGFLLLFQEPMTAIRFALHMHADLAHLSDSLGLSLQVRCGIHVGHTILRHNAPAAVARGAKPVEVEGIVKPTTARIMSLAHGGQTLISGVTHAICRRPIHEAADLAGVALTSHGPFQLKGISDPVEIVEITPPDVEPRRPRIPERIRKRRVSIPSAVALGLLVIAAFTGLFRVPDLYAQQFGLAWLHGPMAIENTVIVGIPDQNDYRQLRAEHPEVLRRLVAGGVTAVVFDIAMTAETDMDPALAEAINEAKAAGVTTVLPVHIRPTETGTYSIEPPGHEDLRNAATLGNVEYVIEERVLGTVVAGRARRRTEDGPIWSTSVLALRAHLNSRQAPRIEDGTLVIGGTRNPVWADKVFLPPFGRAPVQDYFSETIDVDMQGKVAVIGAFGGMVDTLRSPFGSRYGVEFHAALIETLIRQQALQNAPPEVNALGTLLVGLLSALASWALVFRWRLLALAVPGVALTLIAALTWSGILVTVTAPILAAFVGYRVSRVE